MEKEEERISLKKKSFTTVVRLLLDEGKDNIAASTSAENNFTLNSQSNEIVFYNTCNKVKTCL